VAGVAGVDEITSQANENFGYVLVKFKEGNRRRQAAADVSRQVNAIRGDLPDESKDPRSSRPISTRRPSCRSCSAARRAPMRSINLADGELKDRLQAVSGVASVSVVGGRDREVQGPCRPDQLAAYGLQVELVGQALAQENVTAPVGSMDEGQRKNSLRAIGKFANVDEIEATVVSGGPSLLYQLPLPQIPDSALSLIPSGLLAPAGMSA